jgi:hypothetical protein
MAKKPDESRNAWFKSNDPLFEFDGPTSAKDIARSIEQVKMKTAAMVAYKGVQEMNSSVGTKYFDDDDDDDDDEDHDTENGGNANRYISCDPFSKLKFDDLRKVHKDQTVFAVSESDYAKMDRYRNLDHLTELRSEAVQPMDRKMAEHQMAQQEELMKQQMAAKQHAAQLRSMQYEEKNKSVLANFLRIQQG